MSQSTQLDSYYDEYNLLCVGSESMGWIVREDCHLGGYAITYKYDDRVTAEHRSMFESAKLLWTSCTDATITQSNNAIGIITEANKGPTDYVAKVGLNYGAEGHLTSWTLTINSYYNNILTVVDLAHEIGHIWGLVDLYNSNNIGKLMYNSNQNTATGPTESDINGFNVITGIHTTHTWKYTNIRKQCVECDGIKTESHRYVWTDYNQTNHKGTCSLCGVVVYEAHAYYRNAAGNCTRCGRSNVALRIIDQIVEEKY